MKPIFLGTGNNRLYGIYHSPSKIRSQSRSILLCSSLGQEYIRSYRIQRQLADQLARNGHHVMRFDWYGYGDSSGMPEEGNVRLWINNIKEATQELMNTSGSNSVAVVGLRMGGLLSWKGCNCIPEIDEIIFWDPVCSGREWLDQTKVLHYSFLSRHPLNLQVISTDEELLGFPFPKTLQQELLSIDILNDSIPKVPKVHLITSNGYDQYKSFVQKLQLSNMIVSIEIVPSAADVWNNPKLPDRVIMGSPLVPAIVKYFN